MGVLTKTSRSVPFSDTSPDEDADPSAALNRDDPGRLLDGCRQYLLMIANDVIGTDLRAKVGASDLVQDTFLEAHRHFAGFRGETQAELHAWLKEILECRLSNLRRAYLKTAKRGGRREVAIETLTSASEGTGNVLESHGPSPSRHAIRSDMVQGLEAALLRLPEHYRLAVAWRHHERLPWGEIGTRLGCTAEAARMVWRRALEQMSRQLAEHGPNR